jgi:hypothetical protein
MLYNEKDSWTYGELKSRTKIPKKNLEGGLLMLCNPKMKLLEKSISKPKFESDSEIIKVNLEWKHANLNVKLISQGGAKKKVENTGSDNKL